MNILFLTRYNFDQLDGGDKIQVVSTKSALESLGHKVTISSKFVSNLDIYDVVHLFNMQITPHAFLIHALHAKRHNKPVVLSTIYWNPEQWQSSKTQVSTTPNLPKTKRFGGIPLSWKLYYIATAKIFWKWFYLSISKRSAGEAAMLIKRSLIKSVDVILPNGKAELEAVKKDFTRAPAARVIPNGVDVAFAQAKAEDFYKKYKLKNFVLSVGRVESRKNLIPLARAANKHRIMLVLIGNNMVEPDYAEQVMKEGGKYIKHLPPMPHQELGAAYKAARVHALVSWFETPGLSNLEAAAAGCNIVSTSVGPTREYFGNMAWYCDPNVPKSIEKALLSAYTSKKTSRLSKYVMKNFSWNEVAKQTYGVYKGLVK